MHAAFVLQARAGSTRLPRKVLRPFDGERTILDVLLDRLKRNAAGLPLVLATTEDASDDAIEALAGRHGVACHRGPTDDVLARFIGAAEAERLDGVVRVCADNPFLDLGLADALVAAGQERDADYVGYAMPDGTPAIRTHYGFFAEWATAAALRRAHALTAATPAAREHVTLPLYEPPGRFAVRYLPVPAGVAARPDVRLTVDTPEDFARAQELYGLLGARAEADTAAAALHALDARPDWRAAMRAEIRRHQK